MRTLIDLMRKDPNDEVRAEAAKAIQKGGRGAIHYVHHILDAVMQDTNPWVRNAAMEAIVGLGSPAAAQLGAALECSDMDVCRAAVKHLGLTIVDLLETDSDARKPFIEEKMKKKVEVQNEYFAEKHQAKLHQREERRRKRREDARNHDPPLMTPDDSDEDDGIPPESEEGVEEDEFREQSNVELNATITSYVEALAAKIMDPDEQMRQNAIESLKQVRNVVEPHTGKQLLVWQDGRWQARLVSEYAS